MWASNPFLKKNREKTIDIYYQGYLWYIIRRNCYSLHKCVLCVKYRFCKYFYLNAGQNASPRSFYPYYYKYICSDTCLNVLVLMCL